MDNKEKFREASISYDETGMYDIFLIKYSHNLDRDITADIGVNEEGKLIIALNCKAFPMVATLPASEFVSAIRAETARHTENHKCYFCDYNKDDDYVTFLRGFVEAHESCENIVRSNIQEFIESNSEIFTANEI